MDTVLQRLGELLLQATGFVPRLAVAVVVFVVSLVAARLVGRAVTRAARNVDEEIARLLSTLTTVAIVVVGSVIALDQLNFDVTGLVAGLGLIGLTVGFALQDIAKNFVAGIMLLIQQPFDIGDLIEVASHEGTVTDVDIRATTIKTWDGQQVIVPNADVFTSPIINYSKYPARRIVLDIGIGYEEDLTRAQGAFLEVISSLDGVLEDPAPAIHCRNLGSSAVEANAYLWIDQTESNLLQVTSEAVKALKEAAAREGINLPYPVQTVRLRQLSDEDPL